MTLLIKSILLSFFTWVTYLDKNLLNLFIDRPIVIGPIVGLIMGNFEIGLEVGCIIELMFLGQVYVGTALPPEATFSSILAAAFACLSGNTATALAIALPIAILGQMGMYLRNIVLCTWTGHRLESAVERLDRKGIVLNALIIPNLFNIVLFALPVFLAVYFGADLVQSIINAIPQQVIQGISVAGGLIGAVGVAMLMVSINFRSQWYLFLLGFFISSYLGVNSIGCTLVAIICVAASYYADKQKESLLKGEVR